MHACAARTKKEKRAKAARRSRREDTHTVYKNEFVGQDMCQVVKRKTIVLANAVFRTRLEIQNSGARSRLCAFDALETRRAIFRSFIQHASGETKKSARLCRVPRKFEEVGLSSATNCHELSNCHVVCLVWQALGSSEYFAPNLLTKLHCCGQRVTVCT